VHNLVSLSGVLRSLQEADIPFVVMGGQAVGAYGASEGSRDLDIYLAAPEVSVPRLAAWLERVHAQLRYLPSLSAPVLERGHTVHYDVPFGTASVVRLDVCTRPARIADPENLPARAMPYTLADGTTILVMGLSDLIRTKKTQRLKDWGAIEMLLAASHRIGTMIRLWDGLRRAIRPARRGLGDRRNADGERNCRAGVLKG
jgi:hypothetical protein